MNDVIYEVHDNAVSSAMPVRTRKLYRYTDDVMHWHENLEILVFLDDGKRVFNGGEEFVTQRGDIVVINSENTHCVRSVDCPGYYYLFIISKEFCDSFGFNIGEVMLEKKIRDDRIFSILDSVFAEKEKGSKYLDSFIKVKTLEVLLILFRDYQITDGQSDKNSNKIQLVKQVLKYLRENYKVNFSAEDLAKKLGYTKFYVSRVFKDVTGKNVITQLNEIRVTSAEELLRSTDMSMSEIAVACGFENSSYFGKVFKKINNMTPLEYRNRER